LVRTRKKVTEYALGQAKNKLPTIGYTLMLPVAIIIKILYVQFLFLLLR
jgi:putative transport protein